MPQIQSIRRMGRNGESMASIARKQHVSGPTVRKYLRMDDLSEKPPVRKRRGSVVDPYPPLIERWLAEDRGSWRKQRHTATRIWEWLRDEHGAEVSLSTVTRAVARLGRESAVEPGDAFVDLVWHPDEARADFGEVDVLYGGAVQRMRRFVPDFPYSNIGLAQLMPGENAECACQALLDLFEWLGGKPRHAKDEEEAVLFAEGRKALLPLPSKRFDVVTWKRMRADKHGVVTLDGRHRCSTDASHARRDVLVGLRALEIEILDVEGTHPAVRPRAYGQAGTSSEDPSMRLAMPCDRPNAWPNGLVREMLPDPLREWLDRQDEGERRGALRTLRRVDRESGWADAVGAMPTTLESTGGAGGDRRRASRG